MGIGRRLADIVFAGKRLPRRIYIERNGVTLTLTLVVDQKDEYYAGKAHVGDHVCPYAIFVKPSGYIKGPGVLNFIAAGGRWKEKPTYEAQVEVREDLACAVVQAVQEGIQLYDDPKKVQEDDAEVLGTVRDYLRAMTRITWDTGAFNRNDSRVVAALGLQNWVVDLAKTYGLKPSTQGLVENWVSPNYATVEDGAWDETSSEIALTSGVPVGVTEIMKAGNKHFERVRATRAS